MNESLFKKAYCEEILFWGWSIQEGIHIPRAWYTLRTFDIRLLSYCYNKTFFIKLFKKVYSAHFYASFDTFCAQIGQLFEAQ